MPKNQTQQIGERPHIPVLSQEVLDCLQPQAGESYLDLTAGYGGHARQILARTKEPKKAVLVDRDQNAVSALSEEFAQCEIIHQDFLSACGQLAEEGRQFDLILTDLGVSSPHLDSAERGFAFSLNGPLDMRMDQRQSNSAKDLVNDSSEQELARIIKDYGEDPKAKVIARHIIQSRPIETTGQLAKIVARAYGPFARKFGIHPATKTFQALRIAVNDELNQLTDSLPLMEKLLAPGGRLAIISFHSLEDREVKRYFVENAGERFDAELRLITKKPLTPGKDEISLNPRARSAKLRAACKIKNRKDE